MTDSSGVIHARYDYDPYGRFTKVSGDLEADFGFTGFYRHQVSGLNLTMTRAYDANLGRWLSRDTIGEAGGLNLNGFVANNPINRIDPTGLVPGDPTYGLPKAFWNWAHKQPGFNDAKGPDGNIPEDVARKMHQEWKNKGKPDPRKDQRCNKKDDDDHWPFDDGPFPPGAPITPLYPPFKDPFPGPGFPQPNQQQINQAAAVGGGGVVLIIIIILLLPVAA